MLIAALLGFAFGWIGSVPVAGPISALVVTRGIQGRFRAAAWIAVGGGLAEAVYAFLAVWGFSTFLAQYPIIDPISRAGGAVVMTVLGITFIRKKTSDASGSQHELRDSAWGNFVLGAWICAINPTLIATWSAVATSLHGSGAVELNDPSMAYPFAAGCCLGITGWFLTLVVLIRRYRDRFSHVTLTKFVRVIGWLLLALAMWFGYRTVIYFLGSTC